VTRKKLKPKKPVSEKTRVEDERLRESIRHIDLKKFDKLLGAAIDPRAIKPSDGRAKH
jgi:hypothetical protein